MPRLVRPLAICLVVALAGCGGTAWKSTTVSGSPAPGAQRSTSSNSSKASKTAAAAVETAAEKPFIDAMVKGATSAPSGDPTQTPTVVKCVATALVHGYGAAAFTAAGITANALLDPHSSLDGLSDPTDAQVDAIGRALQGCKYIALLAEPLAVELHSDDQATVACFKTELDSPDARRFLVLGGLGRKTDLLAAHSFVGLIAACVDLPTLVLRSANIAVDPDTRSCLLDALQGEDAALKDYMALRVSGTDPSFAEQSYETVSLGINHCRPQNRTGFTVPSG